MSRESSGRYKFKCVIDGRVSQTFRMNVLPMRTCPGMPEAAREMADHIVECHPSGAVIEMKRIGHEHDKPGEGA